LGETTQSIVSFFDKLAKVFFKILALFMRLAPLGAFGGMAYTIGKFGLAALVPMLKLLATVYITLFLFVFVVLNLIAWYSGFSLWRFLGYIKDEILIVLGTASSETVLPRMMDKLEKYGCEKSVVSLVIPTGYAFNLDGSTIYLSMAVVFLAQVYQIPLTWQQELTILGVLMITSKGAAAVTGSALLVLASTLSALNIIPIEGVALLLGTDRFMSEARAITNLIGNGVATLVIAKSENAYHPQLLSKIPQEK
jgi:aerobic C4-dicarboxylate transport protein